MFNAKKAKDMAMKNRTEIKKRNFTNAQKEVETKINKVISEGRFLTTYKSSCKSELELISNWLKELGYSVSEMEEYKSCWGASWHIVIKWEEEGQ